MMRCMRPLLGFVVIGVLLRLASPAHALNIGNPRLVRALTQTDYSSGCSECVPMTDSIAFPSDAYVVIVHGSNGMADGERLECIASSDQMVPCCLAFGYNGMRPRNAGRIRAASRHVALTSFGR